MSNDESVMENIFCGALAIAGAAVMFITGKKVFPTLVERVVELLK